MTRPIALLGALLTFAALFVGAAAGPDRAEAVAASEAEYRLCGRLEAGLTGHSTFDDVGV
jgi:hypothetical protein